MDYEEKYNKLLDAIKELQKANPSDEGIQNWINDNVPELKLSEDEKIRKAIIEIVHDTPYCEEDYNVREEDILAWLEKQGEIDLEHYEDGENEKRKFVGYGFLKCKGDFISFKEGETYWLEYVGKDNYNVRSDNLLGQTFHIKPVELYTVFRPTTWLEKQGQVKESLIPQYENKTYEENIDSLTSEDERGKADALKCVEWSAEDEDMCYKATAVINKLCAEGKEYVWSINNLKKVFCWLKSLRDRLEVKIKTAKEIEP